MIARTHSHVAFLLTVTVVLLATGSSHARAEPPAARPLDVVEYGFEDDAVLGDTIQPGIEVLNVRRRPGRQSLVRARDSYAAELLSSVKAL